ncbi:hypothetical protein 2 [San Bernardo virus]|uniref:hypothetical protein 2 n=1 Tax=San Bernardo virus TaxID=1955199 RepID=UPI0009954F4D|nr:hypothetical protein 2 [San Bernardo virus]AQM55294.1 hypothetical protein 2 [San Bernardo virus]AQM55297.1 hypothetical protein 2 [San Bernardo virus]AQM55300.1 hypothetical protein 2 [San Bernardo virus]
MKFLVLFVSVVNAAVFVKDVTRQLATTRERYALYQNLSPTLVKIGNYQISPFHPDPACVSVYRTNDWFFAGCELPSHCLGITVSVVEKKWYGQETVFCHATYHPDRTETYEFYNIEFRPSERKVRPKSPLKLYGKVITEISNLYPVSFFEYFVVARNESGFGLVPKFCMEKLRNGTQLPKNVQLRHSEGMVCVDEVNYDEHDCHPYMFSTVMEMIMFYDFPIEFTDVPFSQGSFAATNNKAMGADAYVANHASEVPSHVFDKIGRSFMVSFVKMTSSDPFFIVKNTRKLEVIQTHCYDFHTHYKSPFSNFLSTVSKFIQDELSEFLRFLKKFSKSIAEILLFVVSELLLMVADLIPYTGEFYTGAFITLVFYYTTFNIGVSAVAGLLVYFFRIYIDSLIF